MVIGKVNFKLQLRTHDSDCEGSWGELGARPAKRLPGDHDCLLSQEALAMWDTKFKSHWLKKVRAALSNLTESWEVDLMGEET